MTITSSWARASAVERIDEARFHTDVPEGWLQGRGTFGGLVLATMTRATEGVVGAPERRVRTLTGELIGPVQAGPAEIRVEVLRAGSGTTTAAVRLLQKGEVQAHAVIVLGRRRESPRFSSLPRPKMPPWPDVPPLGPGPDFTQHLRYRPTGPLPFSKGPEGHTAGWIELLDPGPLRDAAFVVGMADAWWPAIFSTMDAPRPMATITFTLDLLDDLGGLDPAAPLFHDARTLAVAEGYQPELRTLWGADGRLIAVNHQTFVIIK